MVYCVWILIIRTVSKDTLGRKRSSSYEHNCYIKPQIKSVSYRLSMLQFRKSVLIDQLHYYYFIITRTFHIISGNKLQFCKRISFNEVTKKKSYADMLACLVTINSKHSSLSAIFVSLAR